jgi:hypothetical protein
MYSGQPQSKNNEESTMISKMFRIALTIVIGSFALSSAAWATCSNASVTGIYGYLGGGIDSNGTPTASVAQLTFDPSKGTFTGAGPSSHDGVIETASVSGTYAVASNCTATGTSTTEGGKSHAFSAVVTSTGGVKEVDAHTGATTGGYALAKGSPTCTNAGVKGSFGLEATGVFLAGAPATAGPVHFIGELALTDGVISGEIAGSEDGAIFTFAEEPVKGSYTVSTNCTGTATITPEGKSALNFSFVVVNGGNELLAIETDEHTVVSGTLQR